MIGLKQLVLGLRRIGLPLCALMVAAVLLCRVPASAWNVIGEHALFCAVGLRHPAEQQAASVQEPSGGTVSAPTYPSDPRGYTEVVSVSAIPPKGDGGGAVTEETIGGSPVVGAVAVKNTSGAEYDLQALLEDTLPSVTGDEVQVLIVHTHASECYMSYYAGYYNADDPTRSDDPSQTVVAVGETIARELRARGIGVIHDTTRHDMTYSGAYARSAETVKRHLTAHPTIRVVLDIHRDAVMYEDGTKVKPTATVDGQKAAQIMMIVGGTHSEELPNPHCKENLRLGLQLHNALETAHGGLMRPLYLMDARYNQELHAGSLLLEVGTDANTLSEALYSGRLIGEQLALLLTNGGS